jgi:hypothetical protein
MQPPARTGRSDPAGPRRRVLNIEERANAIGAALQDVLKGESLLRTDFYFYAVVNGQAVFADAMLDNSTGNNAIVNADGRGPYFVVQGVSAYDQGSGLHDVVGIAVSGIFQFTAHEDSDANEVDRVRYGSFRSHRQQRRPDED